MLAGEVRRFGRLPAFWVIGGGLLLLTLFVRHTALDTIRSGLWPASLNSPLEAAADTLLIYNLLVAPFVGILIGSIFMGAEFAWRSWPLLLTQGAQTRYILATKLCAILGFLFCAVLVASLGSCMFALLTHGSGGVAAVKVWRTLVYQGLEAVLFSAFWAFLAALVALASRSTAVAIASVGVYCLVDNVLSNHPTTHQYAVSSYARTVVHASAGALAHVRLGSVPWAYPPVSVALCIFIGGMTAFSLLVQVMMPSEVGRMRL